MKLFVLLFTVLFFSCGTRPVKFVPKTDSVQVVYRDSAKGPFLFTGLYRVARTFHPSDSASTSGKWSIDTAWVMKIQSDTSSHPPHTYTYIPVDSKYIQLITVPR